MNPFTDSGKKSFFGKNLIKWVSSGPKVGRHTRNWRFARMKQKQIDRRRAKNKMAKKSRRINRLVIQGKNKSIG